LSKHCKTFFDKHEEVDVREDMDKPGREAEADDGSKLHDDNQTEIQTTKLISASHKHRTQNVHGND
jgi:hypothetical protein